MEYETTPASTEIAKAVKYDKAFTSFRWKESQRENYIKKGKKLKALHGNIEKATARCLRVKFMWFTLEQNYS